MNKQQIIYIIAGANGAGKTTFACEYLPRYVGKVDFVNADMIAHGLSPFAPDRFVIRAGRMVLQRIKELVSERKMFAIETTLSGRTYLSILQKMKRLGYRVYMYYLWIPNYQLGIERIKNRVREGGHSVPEYIVKRRFKKTLWNLFHVYFSVLDYLAIFDNSGMQPMIIYEKEGEYENIIDKNLFQHIKEEVDLL
ncbi:MAG: zeta toxin family protein [bacterium]